MTGRTYVLIARLTLRPTCACSAAWCPDSALISRCGLDSHGRSSTCLPQRCLLIMSPSTYAYLVLASMDRTCGAMPDLGPRAARDHTLTCSVWVVDGPDTTELQSWRAGELVASRQLKCTGGLDMVSRIVKTAATVAALALAIVTGSPAHAQSIDQPDPHIAATVAYQSDRSFMTTRYPAPDGCRTVGGWEDGTIVAACTDGAWLAHGPDTDDAWTTYHGPRMPLWIDRADAKQTRQHPGASDDTGAAFMLQTHPISQLDTFDALFAPLAKARR